MKKIIFTMIFFIFCGTAFADDTEIPVYLDGNRLIFDAQPRTMNDRTLVPMRTIFEALDYSVEWNEEESSITAVQKSSSGFWGIGLDLYSYMQLTINSNIMTVGTVQYLSTGFSDTPISSDQTSVPLDCTPQLFEDRTFVPLRAIAEATGCNVEWKDDENAVYITSTGDTSTEQYSPETSEGVWL